MGCPFPLCLTRLCDGAEPCQTAACSPAEAPAVQWLLPSMPCPRDCAWLSAFLNWGLEHFWLDAADEIPLKIIALRVTWALQPHFGKMWICISVGQLNTYLKGTLPKFAQVTGLEYLLPVQNPDLSLQCTYLSTGLFSSSSNFLSTLFFT